MKSLIQWSEGIYHFAMTVGLNKTFVGQQQIGFKKKYEINLKNKIIIQGQTMLTFLFSHLCFEARSKSM